METKQIIYELRTKQGLSQDELAEKVYVTRQAVSRWENGDTIPNTETLKLLSKIFDVSINTLSLSIRDILPRVIYSHPKPAIPDKTYSRALLYSNTAIPFGSRRSSPMLLSCMDFRILHKQEVRKAQIFRCTFQVRWSPYPTFASFPYGAPFLAVPF